MRRIQILAPLLTLALAACGGGEPPAAAGGPPGGGMPPIPVETAKVELSDTAAGIATVGSLRADESVVMRPEIAGRIVRIGFAEGERVAAGQLLFALDASTAQASVNEALVNLETSRVALRRTTELVGKKLISQSEHDLIRAQLAVNEARLASARTALAKMELRAPFAGLVGLRQVSVGDYVSVGQDLVNLVRLDPIEVEFSIPETQLGQVRSGQALAVEVDAYAGQRFDGHITAIDPVVDANSRSIKLRAQVPNPDLRLRPGQFARLQLIPGEGDASSRLLLLPEQALMQEGQQRYVYTVVAGKARKTAIRTGRRVPGKVEVLDGLKAGDEVITAGQTKPMMYDGADVAPMTAGGEGKPGAKAPADAAPATGG